MEDDVIRFSVSDTIDGEPVTPKHVPLKLLKSFASEVQEFIADDSGATDELIVSIEKGSLAYDVPKSEISAAALLDLRRLSENRDTGLVAPHRRKAVTKWQRLAKAGRARSYAILDSSTQMAVRVNRSTSFGFAKKNNWVSVERVIVGYVTEAGGRKNPNIHVTAGEDKLTIGASEAVLASQKENLLFKVVAMMVKAKHDLVTGELRDMQLMSFLDYRPEYVAGEIDRLVDLGTEAWSDVDDVDAWLRQARGES